MIFSGILPVSAGFQEALEADIEVQNGALEADTDLKAAEVKNDTSEAYFATLVELSKTSLSLLLTLLRSLKMLAAIVTSNNLYKLSL